jgi:hypothetical protein
MLKYFTSLVRNEINNEGSFDWALQYVCSMYAWGMKGAVKSVSRWG